MQFADLAGNPLPDVNAFKEMLKNSEKGFGIAEASMYDAKGVLHTLRINPQYMGGKYAYALTHEGLMRGQMTRVELNDLIKDEGIIDEFVARAMKGARRRKSRKASKKSRKTRRRV